MIERRKGAEAAGPVRLSPLQPLVRSEAPPIRTPAAPELRIVLPEAPAPEVDPPLLLLRPGTEPARPLGDPWPAGSARRQRTTGARPKVREGGVGRLVLVALLAFAAGVLVRDRWPGEQPPPPPPVLATSPSVAVPSPPVHACPSWWRPRRNCRAPRPPRNASAAGPSDPACLAYLNIPCRQRSPIEGYTPPADKRACDDTPVRGDAVRARQWGGWPGSFRSLRAGRSAGRRRHGRGVPGAGAGTGGVPARGGGQAHPAQPVRQPGVHQDVHRRGPGVRAHVASRTSSRCTSSGASSSTTSSRWSTCTGAT